MESKPPAITLAWIEEQEAFHKKKLSGLAALKVAFLDVLQPEPGVSPAGPMMMAVPVPTGTKKWNCLDILQNMGGLTTAELVVQLQNRGFTDTTQPNTSPQLSLYKGLGLISLDGQVWRITAAGRAVWSNEKN